MTQVKSLNLTGIKNDLPQGYDTDACDHIINMRNVNGYLEPIGKPTTVESVPETVGNIYKPIKLHSIESGDNLITYYSGSRSILWCSNNTMSVVNQTVYTLSADETFIDFQFLKKFLIVATSKRLLQFLLRTDEGGNEQYVQIDLSDLFGRITVTPVSTKPAGATVTDSYSYVKGLSSTETTNVQSTLGIYFKALRDWSHDEQQVGSMFLCYVITLYDGTQILHSIPRFFQFNSNFAKIQKQTDNRFSMLMYTGKLSASVAYDSENAVGSYEVLKDIVKSIDLYGSRTAQMYDLSEDTLTEAQLALCWHDPWCINLNSRIPLSPVFKNEIQDSAAWYKIGTAKFTDLVAAGAIYSGAFTMDMKDYYSNYATRETLRLDNYSHQSLTGNCLYMYNSRLHLADTIQVLSAPEQLKQSKVLSGTIHTASYTVPLNWVADVNYDGYVVIKLNTSNGFKLVRQACTLIGYKRSDVETSKAVAFDHDLGYWDSRAVEAQVYIHLNGVWKLLKKFPLVASDYHNFSYVKETNYAIDPGEGVTERYDQNYKSVFITFNGTGSGLNDTAVPENSNIVLDLNRVQPSEVDNPLVFPAENSQQVSTDGRIVALGTNTEDVSAGQYGQYPLYVFTTKGIWGLSIGSGSVYITNVEPLSGEIIQYPELKLDLPSGILFANSDGLCLISGKEVIKISTALKGLPDQVLPDNEFLQFVTDHANLISLPGKVDKVSFKQYLASGAMAGLNRSFDFSELVIASPTYSYNYRYNLKSNTWTKASGKYNAFVHNYPQLWAVDVDYKNIVNLSGEIAESQQILVLTRAQSLDSVSASKKLRRTIARLNLTTISADKHLGVYVFQSDNLKDWKFVTGNDHASGSIRDVIVTHSFNSARFLAFLIVGWLDVDKYTILNELMKLDIEFDYRMESKLR